MRQITMTALAALALAAPAAAEVDMAHDKDFWRAGIEAVAAEGGFVPTGYTTDQYKAFIQSSLTAGNPPDIFTWWTGTSLRDIVASGAVADVGEIWDAKIAAGELAEGTRALFEVDGTAYALPLLLARWVTFYNPELFAQAGIEGEPETWDDLIAAAEALNAAGITPFHATVEDGWRGFIWFSELMIRQDPEAYAGLHDGSVPYDGPEVRAVFDTWVDWYAKGWFTDPRSADEVAEFASGGAAMYLMGEWATGLLEEQGMTIGKDLSAFVMPNASSAAPPQVVVEGSPLLISNEAFEDDEARASYEFWVSEEGSNIWSEEQAIYNGHLQAAAPNDIIAKITQDMNEGGHVARDRWWEAVPAEIQGDIVSELSAFMLDPTAEKAEETMANMQAINAEYWADQ